LNELKLKVFSGWPLTGKTWKSRGIPRWSGKSQGNWKAEVGDNTLFTCSSLTLL